MKNSPNSCLPWTTLALVAFIAMLPGSAAADDWPYAKHDMGGTARSGGQGAISALSGQLPTLVQTIHVEELDLDELWLHDVDGDGIADLVAPLRGKVEAYSGVDGALLWSTPVIGATDLVGLADLDGDGIAEELVVAAPGMAGGIFAVDSFTGGLLWSYGPLSYRSGVEAVEVEIVDLDGDGADELVFGEWFYGSGEVYVVDFPAGFSSEEVIQLSLPGIYVNLNPLVSGPLVEAGLGFMAHQGQHLAWFEVCAPGDAGASCTPSESVCVCAPELFEMVHPTYSGGPFLAQDVDGDGVDEVIDVLTDSRFGYEMGVYDVGLGMASGSPVTDDLILWTRNYGLPDPTTHVVFPEGELADLDGDGDLDLVATFYDNTTTETDHWGQSAEDGIDHPGAMAVGVFDALSGDLLAWEADAFAWGLVDLDDDGVREIVLSATTGWTYEAGLRGAEIACDPDCSFDTQWMSSGHSLVSNLTQFDDAGFPEATLSTVDTDGNGERQLLAFDGVHLDLLDVDGGSVDVIATALLSDDEEVMAVAEDGSAVLLATETEARLLDAELADIVAPMDLPGQRTPQVAAVQLDPADDKAALIVDGAVFWSVASPTDLADADVLLLDHFAFGTDLTGDGYAELVSWAQPDDTEDGRLEVEVMSFDPTDPDGDGTPFGLLWHFSAADVPELAGYEVIGTEGLSVRPADLDGGGVGEIVLACVSPATYEFMIVALDGITGSVDLLLPVDFMMSPGLPKQVPIWVEDLDDPSGSGSPDGFDDLVLADFLGLHLLAGGATPISSVETGVYHRSGLFGDLTGDGALEMVIVRNSQADPPMTARAVEAGFADVWNGEQIVSGLPTYGIENLALIDADDAAGLDLVFSSGSGTLELYSGQDGALVDGFPLMLSGGAVVAQDDGAAMLGAVAVADVDGDGFEEVIVGAMDGYLYGVNVDADEAGAPTLEWSIFVGVPVERIAVADTDGDGLDEVMVAGPESAVHVVDGLGAVLSIEEPAQGECLTTIPFEVSGAAEGIETVDVWISGVLAASDLPVSGGAWGETGFAVAGIGTWQILATGKNVDGAIVAQAQVLVIHDGDEDGDGITICGGDCDDGDPGTYPGAEELCDGVDNDCDSDVPEDEADSDGDGWSGCEGDCDETDAGVFPGAEEICDNGVDEDCDGEDTECYSPDDDDDDITPETDGCDCRVAGQRGNPAPLALILAAGVWMVARRRQRWAR
jgi:MYXO-CTERM domain-containing protein